MKIYKKVVSSLLAVSIMLSAVPTTSFATSWTIEGVDGWSNAYNADEKNDYLQDQQTGSVGVSQDIVGDENYPSVYRYFSDDEVAFRIRINNIDGGDGSQNNPYQFKNFAFVGLDLNLDGKLDIFTGVYNPHASTGRLGIYAAGAGANTGPSTTSISGKPLMAFAPKLNDNYSIIKADSSIGGQDDYFISFKFKVSDINSAISSLNLNFTNTTPFRFIVGTAAQDNSFNQDLNGMNKDGWNSGLDWGDLGVLSPVVSPDGNVSMNTVIFDKNTGDVAPNPTAKVVVTSQELGPFPSEPTKKGGYVFIGWNTKPDGNGIFYTPSTIINEDITLYAIWSKGTPLNVIFNPNGGSFLTGTSNLSVPTIDGIIGDRMPEEPTNGSFPFLGWYSAPSNGILFDPYTKVASETTYYAIWGKDNTSNVVHFYSNDGNVKYMTIAYNGNSSVFPLLSNNERQIFKGWAELKNATMATYTAGGKIGNGKEGVGFYAVWEDRNFNNVSITFNANGDNVVDLPQNQSPINGYFGNMPAVPTRAGYEFVEWNMQADGQGERIYPTTEIYVDTQVYAIWKKVEEIKFHSNLSPDEIQILKMINGRLTYYPVPPYGGDNKTFLGWGTSPNSLEVEAINIYGDLSGKTDLYGIWADIYDVNFNSNTGIFSDTSSEKKIPTAYGAVLYLPEEPIKQDFKFMGWNTEANGTGEQFTISTPVPKATTVYADWIPTNGKFEVRFDSKGGSFVDSIITDSAIDFADVQVTTNPGYNFSGWYSDKNCSDGNKITWPYTPIDNVTLYAKWDPQSYTLTFDANGGNLASGTSNTKNITNGQEYGTLPNPTLPGKVFTGWYTEMTGGAKVEETDIVNIASDLTLYAHWMDKEYTVKFNTNNGNTIADEKTSSNITLPTPSKNGYDFDGWYEDSNFNGNALSGKYTPNNDITLYAKWNAKEFSLSFEREGGEFVTGSAITFSKTITYNEVYGTLAEVERENYNFAGWFTEQNGQGDSITSSTTVTVLGDITVYAYWTNKIAIAIEQAKQTYEYDGEEQRFNLISTPENLNGFTTEYYEAGTNNKVDNPTDVGNYDVVIKRDEDGTYAELNIKISKGLEITPKPLEDKDFNDILDEFIYNGVEHKPNVDIALDSLVTDDDFEISYKDNIEAGTATIIITGKNNFEGTIEKTFEIVKAEYSINASANGGGMISPSGNIAVNKGENKTFIISANSGYKLDYIMVDGVNIGIIYDYSFDNIQQNHTIIAYFSKNPSSSGGNGDKDHEDDKFIIESSNNIGGYLSNTGKLEITGGRDKSYLITPNEGYKIADVIIDGVSFGVIDNYTFKNISQNHTIFVKFERINEGKFDVPSLDMKDHRAYLTGYPDASFRVDKAMTRAEVATMFSNLIIISENGNNSLENMINKGKFTDITGDEWFANKVNYIASLGIMSGYPDGSFEPNKPITRAEFAVVASRFDHLQKSSSLNYWDLKEDHWAINYISLSVNRGWLGGYPDGSIKPDSSITRAEVATVVNNMLERYCDKTFVDNGKDVRKFNDLDDTHWAYYNVMEAVHSHDYKKIDKSEIWSIIN